MVNGSPFGSAASTGARRIGLLSTYPPLLCGLATFAAALGLALEAGGDVVEVVRINEGGERFAPPSQLPPVVAELLPGRPASLRQAVAALSRCDIAIVQHEYGIYGGPDGEEVLDLLRAVHVPTVVVLHTVPQEPSANQRRILIAVAAMADRVVVMSETARRGLLATYPVDRAKVAIIPHGAAVPARPTAAVPGRPSPASAAPAARHELLTWGLIGPGKGIEHVIDALHSLGPDYCRTLRYTVAGVTHPKVLAHHGDAYRRSLIEQTERYGMGGCVVFDDAYRDVAQLTALVAAATLVVLPYDSRQQVTSGVLVDAVAAGRPVIATAFPHAVEVLSGGAGTIVSHADPIALAAAIRDVLDHPARLASMRAEAERLAPSLSWRAVAARYAALADVLIASTGSTNSGAVSAAM